MKSNCDLCMNQCQTKISVIWRGLRSHSSPPGLGLTTLPCMTIAQDACRLTDICLTWFWSSSPSLEPNLHAHCLSVIVLANLRCHKARSPLVLNFWIFSSMSSNTKTVGGSSAIQSPNQNQLHKQSLRSDCRTSSCGRGTTSPANVSTVHTVSLYSKKALNTLQ